MKKFFAVCSLLALTCVGAKAVEIGADDLVGVSISTYKYNDWSNPAAGSQKGAEVTMIIDKDYKTVLTVPAKTTKFYLDSVIVESRVQNCFGIEGVNHHVKTLVSGFTNEYRVLYDQIPNTFDFEGTKTFTVQVCDLNKITFTVSKEQKADGSYVITMVPDNAQLVRDSWEELKNHVENTEMNEKDYAVYVTEGSYIQNSKERLYCNQDILIDDKTGRPNLQKIQDATIYYECSDTQKFTGLLTPGSYVKFGKRHMTLAPGNYCHLSISNSAKNIYFPGLVANIKDDIDILLAENDDDKFKLNAVDDVLKYMHNVDERIYDMFPLNVKIWFTDDATAISEVNADAKQTQSIYTLDGRKVNCANEHGIYIINGKKVVK